MNFDPRRGVPRRPSARLQRTGKNHFSPQARFDFLIFPPVIVLVVAFYFWTTMSNGIDPSAPSKYFYPLLARAFVEGHLYLDVPPSPKLLALQDPYDPQQSGVLRYAMGDATLYHGKYYLYFGPTPAILLFAPYLVFTDCDFPQKIAVPIFCSIGFVISAQLFLMILRDHFFGVPVWLKLTCVLSLGMANLIPFLQRTPDVYETAIACAYGLLQLVFLAIYCAMRNPKHALRWLLLASIGLGACAGARFDYSIIGFIFVGLLIGLWRQRWLASKARAWLPLMALAPIGLIGLLLAWYNYARFGSPLEFGTHYVLAGWNMHKYKFAEIGNVPYNIWFNFFSPPHLSSKFPFIDAHPYIWFHMPDRFFYLDKVAGLFLISPVSLFALALPVLLRPGPDFRLRVLPRQKHNPSDRSLVWTAAFMAGAGLAVLPTILYLNTATMRYIVDFASTFVFLGCLMICHFQSLALKQPFLRLFRQGAFVLILFLGCGTGLLLSFSGEKILFWKTILKPIFGFSGSFCRSKKLAKESTMRGR